MLTWNIEQIVLQLKYAWKISRNSSDEKTNLIVSVMNDHSVGKGEAAPNIRYHETPELLLSEFTNFNSPKANQLQSIQELHEYMEEKNLSNALRFAIESAFIHLLSSQQRKSVPEFLSIPSPPDVIPTSYSIPIMDIGMIKEFYDANKLSRFPVIKIKIDHETGTETIEHLSRFCPLPLIVDANESYADVEECIHFLEKIKKKNILFIEQPLPAALIEEAVHLKKHSPFTLFADESVTDTADFSQLKKMFDGVNVKLMKAGGYMNGIRLLNEAKQHNLQTMIGCMVETTLAISSAMNLAALADYLDLDSFLVVKNESFGLVTEESGNLKINSR
jgi:L-alanine-DL-glutamate epimerase-like enolase superfamily enzyme